MKYGKLFINQTAVVLVKDFKKQMELKSLVRDSGGNILNWTCKDLGLKRDEDLLKINVIYTDLSDDVLEDLNFKKFTKKRESLGNAVIIRSYYCIFKLLTTYPRDKDREYFEKTFDVQNTILMNKLHPIFARKGSSFIMNNKLRSVRSQKPESDVI